MPLKQSRLFRGNSRVIHGTPKFTNLTATIMEDFVLDEAVAAADVLELIPLPAYAKLIDFSVWTSGIAAGTTLTYGLVSGRSGLLDNARTCSNALGNAVAGNLAFSAALNQLAAVPKLGEMEQSLGVSPAAGLSIGNRIIMRAEYVYTQSLT